ncbi:hypothetical protein [Paraburkholderia bannensis]
MRDTLYVCSETCPKGLANGHRRSNAAQSL